MSKFVEDFEWEWEFNQRVKAETIPETIKRLKEGEQLKDENKALKLKMQIHAGDICSISNENERFTADKYEAEERADKLEVENKGLRRLLEIKCQAYYGHSRKDRQAVEEECQMLEQALERR